MPIPVFPEAQHSLIKSLAQQSDQALLELFARYPETGQYFVALFCRYTPLIYPVVVRSAQTPIRSDYLFALVWRHIFNELGGLDITRFSKENLTFQGWLLQTSATYINQVTLPPVEEIHYDIKASSPPFWCYIDRALDEMPPDLRLMIVMAQTYNWSETRISAYLQAEGEIVPPLEVKKRLSEGYQALEKRLPEDIRSIYLTGNPRA